MSSNPSPDTPIPSPPNTYPAYLRWWRRHVLHLHKLLPKRRRINAYAKHSLAFAGRMHYTEGPMRRDLFNRKPGHFDGASADCSQYAASLCHWSGVKDVTDTDWTGTLGQKGLWLVEPVPGCFVFFGSPPYVHMAVMVDKRHAIGFGDPQAPDESTLAGLIAYFAGVGHPGHTFRDLTR